MGDHGEVTTKDMLQYFESDGLLPTVASALTDTLSSLIEEAVSKYRRAFRIMVKELLRGTPSEQDEMDYERVLEESPSREDVENLKDTFEVHRMACELRKNDWRQACSQNAFPDQIPPMKVVETAVVQSLKREAGELQRINNIRRTGEDTEPLEAEFARKCTENISESLLTQRRHCWELLTSYIKDTLCTDFSSLCKEHLEALGTDTSSLPTSKELHAKIKAHIEEIRTTFRRYACLPCVSMITIVGTQL